MFYSYKEEEADKEAAVQSVKGTKSAGAEREEREKGKEDREQ